MGLFDEKDYIIDKGDVHLTLGYYGKSDNRSNIRKTFDEFRWKISEGYYEVINFFSDLKRGLLKKLDFGRRD